MGVEAAGEWKRWRVEDEAEGCGWERWRSRGMAKHRRSTVMLASRIAATAAVRRAHNNSGRRTKIDGNR